MNKTVTVIGAAVVDVFAGAVDKDIFTKVSVPAENMGLCCGGDALNEAVFLSTLGLNTELVTLLGDDNIAQTILKRLKDKGISADKITIDRDITTGMCLVLVDSEGERYFINKPNSSLRLLSKEHILPHVDAMGDIVSFASIFISHKLSLIDLQEVFSAIKKDGKRKLVADMTLAKNGETIDDLAPVLKYIDYIIPNEREASLLTGDQSPEKSALSFIEHGANCVIIKCGKDGCIYMDKNQTGSVPAYKTKVVDTTGAGDSFVSGFIYGLSHNMDLPDCCRYGCAVASNVVEHMGAQETLFTIEDVNSRFEAI